MDQQSSHTLLRYVRLRDDLKPVPIYSPDPISAEWLAITFAPATPKNVVESYVIFFFDSDGRELEFLQFDTLDIALDQAHAIVGVKQDEWHQCSKPLPDEWEDFDLSVFA